MICNPAVLLGTFLLQCAYTTEIRSCSAGNQDAAASLIQNFYSRIQEGECRLANNTKYSTYDPSNNELFDFIIVGAGAAGSVLANRLSEEPTWKILVLEAGSEPSVTTEIPGLCVNLLRTPEDWNYFSEPGVTNCLGMNDGKCPLPRGKVLGGSTSINFMVNLRGNPKDYDSWAASGNTGWDFESVLPYFKRSENIIAREVVNSPNFRRYHGTSGLMKVDSAYRGDPEDRKTFFDYISKGFADLGLGTYPDVNAPGNNIPGLYRLQGVLDEGTRCSAAKAFIKPAQRRKNLYLSIKSLVTKILIKDKKAYGVEFLNKNNNLIKVKVKNEIILSAGAYNSPKILMLSGIGPKKHLKRLGIGVVQDSPVGQNLQDHLCLRGFLLSSEFSLPRVSLQDQLHQYLTTFTGSLTGITSESAFIDSSGMDYPDIQMFFDAPPDKIKYFNDIFSTSNINETYQKPILKTIRENNIIEVKLNLLRPESRGNVLLRSTDPADPPKIYLNFFTKLADLRKTISGIRFVEKFCNTRSMKHIGCSLVKLEIPGCSYRFNSDEYWECLLKSLSQTMYHPVGTCKMAPSNDSTAVVDPQLRVNGVRNLRVVDASIMPTIVSANTMAATYMIAEKGSDMVKSYWLPDNTESAWKFKDTRGNV